ncbi:hypothetical protein CEXT_174201 [Caerostris extrusa]|uniref:Uncharacterized protein n=1 Tax=Caerostris extrusa TaxID=172846 RepID=A0AAV4R565_CAEEX|nr:hypothetical protein CEXT_174201 [Caerostris extrusa]
MSRRTTTREDAHREQEVGSRSIHSLSEGVGEGFHLQDGRVGGCLYLSTSRDEAVSGFKSPSQETPIMGETISPLPPEWCTPPLDCGRSSSVGRRRRRSPPPPPPPLRPPLRACAVCWRSGRRCRPSSGRPRPPRRPRGGSSPLALSPLCLGVGGYYVIYGVEVVLT